MGFYAVGARAAARDFAPFLGAAVLAWASVPVATPVNGREYLAATGLLLVAAGLRLLRFHWLTSRTGSVVPSLVFLAALGLLRNAGGGISSGVGAVALVPVFFIALHGKGRRELYVVLAGVAAFYLVPLIFVGPPAYPHTQYRAALLSVAVGWIAGVAVQELVARVREQAAASELREQMLADVRDVMRGLYGSAEARADVCIAARDIGGARCALIYEPVDELETLRSTAMVGLDASHVDIGAERSTAVWDALVSGAPVLLTEDIEARVGSLELWRAAGSPQAVLYEPLMRGEEPVGVLVVGWSEAIQASDTRVTTVKLLAHEVANVLHRADIMGRLTDMAQTDPLTRLPNRRAWDVSVKHALSEGRGFTVAMIDFDHFKDYNDTYGHPAGDRLLRESASTWLDMLRTGDVLARLGGEEFGLLLLDCDTDHAFEVIERLRQAIYGAQTCSAGFAQRLPDEPIESVMSRADEALYLAKSTGRDRACMSEPALQSVRAS